MKIKFLILIVFCNIHFSKANTYSILDFGAKIDGLTDDTVAVQKAIDKCANDGGGTIFFPSGICLTGTIYLKSNIAINLSPGAMWKAVNSDKAFPYLKTVVHSRENKSPRRAMVYACDVENIKIYGEGTIDGGGDYDIFKVTKDKKDRYSFRPFGLYFVKCKNIALNGLKMQNSAFWMQRYQSCDNIRLTNLNIYNHSNFNNDGIDIDGCEDVVINNCIVDSTDDALCIKSEGLRSSKNIVISDCILSSHATPLKLGTGSIGGFENIVINNISIRPSKSKTMIHELKSWKGLSGIDILCVDGGTIDGLTINNIVMDSIETPFFIKLGNRYSKFPGMTTNEKGKIQNIQISNLIAKNTGGICSMISGYKNGKIKNISLKNIFIHVSDGLGEKLLNEEVPENSNGYPYNRMHGEKLPATGLFIRHAEEVLVDGLTLELEASDKRPGVYVVDGEEIMIKGFRTSGEQSIKNLNSSIQIKE